MNRMQQRPQQKQKGAVLIIGLMLLLVLVILGVASSQGAIIQEKLAGNFRDIGLAFRSAEAETRWSSAWLQSLGRSSLSRPFPCLTDCDNVSRVWDHGVHPSSPSPNDETWDRARAYGVDPSDDSSLDVSLPLVYDQPRYIMEQQQFLRDDLAGDPQKGVAFYRVTGRGLGARPTSTAIVRAVIAKRFE